MTAPHDKRTLIKVDASVFDKQIGDHVKKGEQLGRFAGRTVEAPFDATVQSVSFDSDEHALLIVLIEAPE